MAKCIFPNSTNHIEKQLQRSYSARGSELWQEEKTQPAVCFYITVNKYWFVHFSAI